jgi:hypothetical protein
VSFDQLMQHAFDIQAKAIAKSMERHGVRPAAKPGDPPLAPMPGEDEERAKIVASFSEIPSLFEPFTMMPMPSSFDGLINDIGSAMRLLSSGYMTDDPITGQSYLAQTVFSKIGASESYMELWTGHLAGRPSGGVEGPEFIEPFPAMVVNQFIGCAVLRGALAAQRELWSSAQNNIDKVAHDALNALDNMDHCGQNNWTMTWTIVASVAAVAAVPISAGTSLEALAAVGSVTAVGAASQVVAAHQVDPPKETHYHGETAEVVIDEVRRGVSDAIAEIQRGQQKVVEALDHMHAAVSQNRPLFIAPQPNLVDATPRNIFTDEYLGRAR